MSDEERDVSVVNIVISSDLEKDIPLEKLAVELPNTEYNPEQFPGLTMRFQDKETSALIFSSGKIVVAGAKSLDEVDESIDQIIENLKEINIEIEVDPEVTVTNLVASGNIGMTFNLNILAIKMPNTEYEPEQFPGLLYKLEGTRATFLLFTNGKIVCAGVKTEEEAHEATEKLAEKLKEVTDRD